MTRIGDERRGSDLNSLIYIDIDHGSEPSETEALLFIYR